MFDPQSFQKYDEIFQIINEEIEISPSVCEQNILVDEFCFFEILPEQTPKKYTFWDSR